MKKTFVPIVLLIGLILSLTGCGSVDEGEKCADKFFKHIIDQNFEEAVKLVDLDPLTAVDLEVKIRALGENEKDGKLLSAKKGTGFSTNVSNGITTVELPYNLKYEKATYNFQVVIVDRGNGFKIVAIR
ncbi:MAG: hypothetical protein HRT57_13190 [Crocinitomicaceae bacterium]|nr:hypothetical protein [Crocinitomicaceae bacterium]